MEARAKNYLISVVIPIYNTQDYLEETIESIVDQSIGFEENIQLILVDNASEDESETICKRYLERFPRNVVFQKLEVNRGPCPARNIGLDLAEGKYINFLDSDDKWAPDALEKAVAFLEAHGEEVDFVSCRIRHFDATDNWHGLDWKFESEATQNIISIRKNYKYIQLHVGATLIKTEIAKQVQWDERIRHAEDAKFITEVLLRKQQYALLADAIFYYRTRSSGNSVLQNVQRSRSWYFDTPRYVYQYLLDISIERYGCAIKYIQFLVMYELQWRLRTPLSKDLSKKDTEQYLKQLIELLSLIDDSIIMEQRNLFREYKFFAFSLKYGETVCENYSGLQTGEIYYHNEKLYSALTPCVEIGHVQIKDNTLQIEGRLWMVLPQEGWSLHARVNDDSYSCDIFYLNETEKCYSLGKLIHERKGFSVMIPLSKERDHQISFEIKYHDMVYQPGISYAFICKLTDKVKNAFLCLDNYMLLPGEKKYIDVIPLNGHKKLRAELKYDCQLIKARRKRVLAWRWLIILARMINKRRKPIWLFADKFEKCDDNAQFLFEYICEKKPKEIRPIFVVDRNSEYYHRMRKIGKTVKADTKKYRLLFALSDKVISSQSFYNASNTFYNKTELLQDLFHFKFIYLQHGVIKDNHADTQSKLKKNFDLFITSSYLEKDSIVNGVGGNYLYGDDVVKVTGLARYDLIDINAKPKQKKILLAPTWRYDGIGRWDERAQTYEYSPGFKHTKFCKFYNALINDERLLKALEKTGYRMIVRLHPRTIQQASDFSFNQYVQIESIANEYIQEMREISLLITDYSSIAFDYAYASIPVIYSQFDLRHFYAHHAYQRGYFDYERDGFGPVCYDYESTLQAIISMIQNDCVMAPEYKERVDHFFAFRDQNNRERIYNEIFKLDKERVWKS